MEKCKKEPTRCLKCQGWGHLSYACPQLYDTCGTCGDRHRTSACTNMNRLHCTSCKTHTHASWDRMCPSFMRRCEEMDRQLPETEHAHHSCTDARRWMDGYQRQNVPIIHVQMQGDGSMVTRESNALLPHSRALDTCLTSTQNCHPYTNTATTRKSAQHWGMEHDNALQQHTPAGHPALQVSSTGTAGRRPGDASLTTTS